MTPRAQHHLGLSKSGFHNLAYLEWGERATDPVLICVHGLTRNGRDFDPLARVLGERFLVLCPDVVGRGTSDALADPADYGFPQYMSDMTALIARSGAAQVDWIGTSMGGLIGMMLAAQPKSPIRRLVINDVGPFLPAAALKRIGDYVGEDPSFADLDAAEAYMRVRYASFGRLTDDEWRHLTRHSFTAGEDGQLRRTYDFGIAQNFKSADAKDVDLWPLWDSIACPTLVIRGADSDLLLPETAAEMAARGPKAEVVEIADCGHAPALMARDQIEIIERWLDRTPA